METGRFTYDIGLLFGVNGGWVVDNMQSVEQSGAGAWYVARTYTQRETLAEFHLQRQNYTVFLPRTFSAVKSCKRPPGAKPSSIQTRAFFPGYLFVRLDLDRDRWRCVNSTFGVIGLVQFGERPAPAPRGFVESLMARTSASGAVAPDDNLAIGDAVRILGGPFDQMVATLCATPARDRVRVLVDMMTRTVQIEMPRAALLPLKSAHPSNGGNDRHQ